MKMKIAGFPTTFVLILVVACGQPTATTVPEDGITQADETNSPTAADTLAEKVKHGEYLVQIAACSDCHTPLKMTDQGPVPDMDRYLSGHPSQLTLPPFDPAVGKDYVLINMTNTAIHGPWGTSYTANLTPDSTGTGSWTEEQFARAIREGKSKGLENGRPLLPPMPWQNYQALKDEDVSAIFAYLRTIKPVENLVPAAVMAMQ